LVSWYEIHMNLHNSLAKAGWNVWFVMNVYCLCYWYTVKTELIFFYVFNLHFIF
jgi:hypothetical protein